MKGKKRVKKKADAAGPFGKTLDEGIEMENENVRETEMKKNDYGAGMKTNFRESEMKKEKYGEGRETPKTTRDTIETENAMGGDFETEKTQGEIEARKETGGGDSAERTDKTGGTKEKDDGKFIEISNWAIAALLLVIVLLAAAIYVAPNFSQAPERRVNQTEFEDVLAGVRYVSVIMNITDASENGSRAVMQCGVDISGSMGRLDKNVSNYVFDGEVCVNPEVNEVGISECSKAMNEFYFIVGYGPNVTRYYERHVEIEVNEQFGQGCYILRRD